MASVSKTQKILLKSDIVKGIVMFHAVSGKVQIRFGEIPVFVPNLATDTMHVFLTGLLEFSIYFRFGQYKNLVIAFDLYSKNLTTLFFVFVLMLVLILLGFYLQGHFFAKAESVNREIALKEAINSLIENRDISPLLSDFAPGLVGVWQDAQHKLEKAKRTESEAFASAKMAILAAQTAHDIRSPLTGLNILLDDIATLPEERRLLIRNSIHRVNDISNQLLEQSRKYQAAQKKEAEELSERQDGSKLPLVLLAPLVDSIVSEKRVQFRDKMNIQIEADLNNSYGLFVRVEPMELSRVLSNLITNSVEAFGSGGGAVTLSVRGYREKISLVVSDNGHGIPQGVLAKLGEKGVSHGKEGTQSGSGLGVYHAKKTIESFRGSFEIVSKAGMGTMITINLKRQVLPKWFVSELSLKAGQPVIALDDDQTIHGVWAQRLQKLNGRAYGIELISFTSGVQFKTANQQSELYLIDYELLGQKETGLDIIEAMGIQDKSILVTSRYEEKEVLERCQKLGVRLIPKSMAAAVPISILVQTEGDG